MIDRVAPCRSKTKSISARLTLTALLIAVPGWALAWWAWNRHEVFPIGDGIVEVIGEPGSGAQDYWCAIGDFATSQLRVPAAQRLYTWRGVGPSVARPGRKAMQFALSAPKGADTTPGFTLSLKRVGDNMTAAMARQYCFGGKFDPWDRWLN